MSSRLVLGSKSWLAPCDGLFGVSGQIEAKSISERFQDCYSALLRVCLTSLITSLLTIKHVLFNQAQCARLAAGWLQGIIGTVRGR